MTAKEKARELVSKFNKLDYYISDESAVYYHNSTKCALICVDEIIENECRGFEAEDCDPLTQKNIEFWQEVKQEIEKLR